MSLEHPGNHEFEQDVPLTLERLRGLLQSFRDSSNNETYDGKLSSDHLQELDASNITERLISLFDGISEFANKYHIESWYQPDLLSLRDQVRIMPDETFQSFEQDIEDQLSKISAVLDTMPDNEKNIPEQYSADMIAIAMLRNKWNSLKMLADGRRKWKDLQYEKEGA